MKVQNFDQLFHDLRTYINYCILISLNFIKGRCEYIKFFLKKLFMISLNGNNFVVIKLYFMKFVCLINLKELRPKNILATKNGGKNYILFNESDSMRFGFTKKQLINALES